MESTFHIKWFPVLDSTNNELLRHIRDYDNLSVIAAVNQTDGRGQRGNRWLSGPGENLTFSLLLKPQQLPARESMSVICLSTLVIRDCLREEGISAVIKWPNDIYVGSRKICGMLVENGFEDSGLSWSVVGIGLNLNQTEFPGELVNPTSVKRLTGRTTDPAAFLESICRGFEPLLPELETPEGRGRLRKAYAEDLFQKDRSSTYRNLVTGEIFTGIIRGITAEGLLRMETEGTERTFGFKEVGYIL